MNDKADAALRDDTTMTGRVLLDLLDMTSLVTATVQVENNNRVAASNEKLANGVNIGTNYRVYSIDKVHIRQHWYKLQSLQYRQGTYTSTLVQTTESTV